MNNAEIYEECKKTVENKMIDSLLFYFEEYPSQRNLFIENFKKAFNILIYKIIIDLAEEEQGYKDYRS